jgi:type II secretory pathway pseudopilin PulG
MKKNSFTLLEAIFAISILIFTLTGSFALISRLLGFSPQIQSKLIASYLAQEGIEIVRNIRDTNWIQNQSWLTNLSTTTSAKLDYLSNSFPDSINCVIGDNDPLNFNGNYYTCRAGTPTKFKRKITLTQISPDEIEVLVEVSWQEKGTIQKVRVKEHLYNWK